MIRTFRLSAAMLLLSSILSGCVIWPWYEDDGHGHGRHGDRGGWHDHGRGGRR